MALVSDVKCGKCDRRYSGLRGRCPYCGARRGKAGKHANHSSNTTGKVIIGLILVAVIIAAVIFLVVNGGKDKTTAANAGENTAAATEQTQASLGNDEDVTSLEGEAYVPEPEKTDENTDENTTVPDGSTEGDNTSESDSGAESSAPEKTDAANEDLSVFITWLGDEKTDMTLDKGMSLTMSYSAFPEPENPKVIWTSSDQNIFTILQTGELTAVGEGTATLTLSVNGVTAECIVRVS